jgi:alkylation response protein AidB-like acyl-CoA dehydrogenase
VTAVDLSFSPDDASFRAEVHDFIRDHYPAEMRVANPHSDLTKQQMLLWHRVLYKKGWIAPGWPREFGGTGWSVTQRYIWEQESAAADTLPPLAFGVTMVGPVIYTFGTAAQRERFLPGILSGDDWWCQGYSEPGAGSDLASLRTRAVRDGNHYVVNGHKTWTTLAQHAEWIFCLVRTDLSVKPQQGISFLLIDMRSPGVTVRPIVTIDGVHEVNDVFLDDVRVPVENRIGEENHGWDCAKFLLGNERTSMAGTARSRRRLDRLKQIAANEMSGGRPLIETDAFARQLARVEIELMALEVTELRVLSAASRGERPGAEASLFKIKGTEIQQRLTELALEAVGNYGLLNRPTLGYGDNEPPPGPDYAHLVTEDYLNTRKKSIYGGSNEIQRNIIAKAVLNL